MAAIQATVTGAVMATAVMVTAAAILILPMDQAASITAVLPSGSGFTVVDPRMDAADTMVVIVADTAVDTVAGTVITDTVVTMDIANGQ